ncbi:MAG: NapC/NirT family cytochrome c, partial [Anaerosomatales bacterium]|nr:NapC/NirT family cytochrome c [Anaerosomatales bacterium]
MARISLAGFKDPVRRPRYLVWTGVALLALAVVVIVGVGATSTYGFCANLCHSVQDDAIAGYDASAHNTVSCISCHEPVAADPVTFLYYKAKAGIIGAYQLYTKTYEVPLNPESALAMNTHHMGSEQCTQCHSLETRVV